MLNEIVEFLSRGRQLERYELLIKERRYDYSGYSLEI
jgi:hypothetical protein